MDFEKRKPCAEVGDPGAAPEEPKDHPVEELRVVVGRGWFLYIFRKICRNLGIVVATRDVGE